MVRAFDKSHSIEKSKSFKLKRMFEINSERQAHSYVIETEKDGASAMEDQKAQSRSYVPRSSNDRDQVQVGWVLDRSNDKGPISRLTNDGHSTRIGPPQNKGQADLDMMKERFAKLLLGEDMSGCGKGVSSALALSNAITNLAASVFGEQSKLEPMPAERKARWRKEIDWLLSVTDHIVEFVASQQTSKDGTNMEIMVTKQRSDLVMNIPALRKLDAMLISHLDNFRDNHDFWYVKKQENESDSGNSQSDKWWLPDVKVPPNGLSDVSKKWLLFQKDSVNQVLKAAMAINAQVLSEMEIPDDYIESLPKNGRSSLGDSIYKNITIEYFDPSQFLSTMDLSTEHKVLDLKNRIEASIVIWRRKMHQKDGKSHWGSAISLEKRELFEERAETILLILKQRFPGLPQSALDISKIQYNMDVGYSILEAYSRILESLAYTVMSRIEDVLQADSVAQNPSLAESKQSFSTESSSPYTGAGGSWKSPNTTDDNENMSSSGTPNSFTLSDFMGWPVDKGDGESRRNNCNSSPNSKEDVEEFSKGESENKIMTKLTNIVTNKKISYMEKLENLGGLRSPNNRHW